jgi:type I restriction enzyme S subunit
VFDFRRGLRTSPERRIRRDPKPFLRVRDVRWLDVDVSSVDRLDFTEEEVEGWSLQPGDLLVCGRGGGVGRAAVWEGQFPVAFYSNDLYRLREKDASVESRFVLYWLQVAHQVFHVFRDVEADAAAPRLLLGHLKKLPVPLPPLGDQLHIAATLWAIRMKIGTSAPPRTEIEAELVHLERAVGFGAEGGSVLASREAHGGASTHLSHARDAELVHA